MRLVDIFNQYGTDKGINGYADVYESLFKNIRTKVRNILEVGVGTVDPKVAWSMRAKGSPIPDHYRPGGSLRAWRDYFPEAMVYGIDVQPDAVISEDRIVTAICDSGDAKMVKEVVGGWGVWFDIIIDDGNHHGESQLQTLRSLWQYVNDGGYYVIEDVMPGSPLLLGLKQQLKVVVEDSSMFVTEAKNFVVISRP